MSIFNSQSTPGDGAAGVAVREPVVHGAFYPEDPLTLETMVERFIADAPMLAQSHGPVRAIISPHAGYRYSGPTAAANFKLLRPGQFERVIVLAPSHYVRFDGVSVGNFGLFRTPLGEVTVDQEAVKRLRRCELVNDQPGPHRREHALEVQLPFLQKTLGQFQLLPVVVGDLTPAECDRLAECLVPLWDSKTLVVVSSDFCHYGDAFDYEPFGRTNRDRIAQLDGVGIDQILALNPAGFDEYLALSQNTICGRTPISILLRMARHGKLPPRPVLAAYALSGDEEQDYEHSVSYAAIAFCETGQPWRSVPTPAAPLDEAEKRALLRIARESLEQVVAGRCEEPVVGLEGLTPNLMRPGAAFVTLTIEGELRGCIGCVDPHEPLALCVAHYAVHAAMEDSRFDPVQPKELPEIHIEVNVLSPPFAVSGIEAFLRGRHGLILEKDGHRGLFLPEVMTEYNWTPEETLSQLCRKAHLSPEAWRTGYSLQCFETQAFGEGEA